MNPRTIIVCALSLAALAGALVSGVIFSTLDASSQPTAWLFNLTACLMVSMLGFTIKGGTYSISFLLSIIALCLPAIGPAVAALVGLAIHLMRPAREEEDRYIIGNPVSERSATGRPGAVLGRPLVDSIHRLSSLNLFRLLTGIGSLPPKHARPVLTHLRDCDDAQLQLFAQGGLNDPLESSERHLKALARRARLHPQEVATQCAIAEINLHLLENDLVEQIDRPATWDAAVHAITAALEADPSDALSIEICARINLIGGNPGKAALAARSLAKLSGYGDRAKLLLAEVAFDSGEFELIPGDLEGVASGAAEHDDILDFWHKPRPAAYA